MDAAVLVTVTVRVPSAKPTAPANSTSLEPARVKFWLMVTGFGSALAPERAADVFRLMVNDGAVRASPMMNVPRSGRRSRASSYMRRSPDVQRRVPDRHVVGGRRVV